MMEHFDLERLLLTLPGILIGFTLHEFMHAYAAFLCGDETAKEQGRLTLNPVKHIDPLGLVFIIFAGFGWAKPVSFNDEKLRNPKRDTMLIAMAGPLTNAAIAVAASAFFVTLLHMIPYDGGEGYTLVLNCLLNGIFINWGLFVFNMLPIPPLDGSHLIFHAVRHKPELYEKIYRYGTMALFGILLVESRANIDILPIGSVVTYLAGGVLGAMGYTL